jgi:hypothetical protein
MKKLIIFLILLALIILLLIAGSRNPPATVTAPVSTGWWDVQSVDTMKYSRDYARQALTDSGFAATIDQQVSEIASVGATHVAVATPYDDEFLPVLRMWVVSARKYGLKVWFRGNWSGWEGWFNYPKISRTDHLNKTKQFILGHPDLFENGDIFTACPECENGGPGDPRFNTGVGDYRQFLIDEYEITRNAFVAIHKNVRSNFLSMNADVARLVMDRATTSRLGGIITIDHYVGNPAQYAADIESLITVSGGRVMLGEFGAPIPDITGDMSAGDQASWLHDTLNVLASHRTDIVGVNYWVGVGGTTQIWDNQGNAAPAVSVLHTYYIPNQKISLLIKNELDKPQPKVPVTWLGRVYWSNAAGRVDIPYIDLGSAAPGPVVGGNDSGFNSVAIPASASALEIPVTVTPVRQNIFYKISKYFVRLLNIK